EGADAKPRRLRQQIPGEALMPWEVSNRRFAEEPVEQSAGSFLRILTTCRINSSQRDLRVRPETSGWIAKFSEHEADGGEAQESERRAIEVLPIFGEPPATVEPRQ